MPEAKKSLEQLEQDALNSQFGLSDADLELLFEDDTGKEEPDIKSDGTVTPPSGETVSIPPASSAGQAQTQDDKTVGQHQAQPGDMPDWAGVQTSLQETQEQVKQLQQLVQDLLMRKAQTQPSGQASMWSRNPQQPQQEMAPPELEEVTDETIIQNPKSEIMKLMVGLLKSVLPAAFAEYDLNTQRRMYVEAFRAQHPDFDELRPIMRQIVTENPAYDDVLALPQVYEEAKRRRAQILEKLRKELLTQSAQPQPQSQPEWDEAKLAVLEQKLLDRIRKRKAASGMLTSDQSAPIRPAERQTATQKEKPMSPEDQLLMEMLNSGPASERFLKDLEAVRR